MQYKECAVVLLKSDRGFTVDSYLLFTISASLSSNLFLTLKEGAVHVLTCCCPVFI